MAATIDDLLYVASAMRVDVRTGFEDVTRALGSAQIGGGGVGAGGPKPPEKGGLEDRLGKITVGAVKASAVLNTFTTVFDKFIQGMGAGITKFVALANPAAVMRWNMAMENAMSALGRVFIPLLDRFTHLIQMLGDAIESLSPQAKSLIAGLTAGGGLAAIFGAIAAAAALLVKTFGGLPMLIGTLVAAFAGVFAATADGQQLMAGFAQVLKVVGTVFEEIAKVLVPIVASTAGPVLKALGDVLATLGGVVVRVMEALAPGLKALAQLIAALAPVFEELVAAVAPLAEAILVPLAALFSALAQVVAAVFIPILKELASVIRDVAEFIIDVVKELLSFLGLEMPGKTPEFKPDEKRAQAVRQSQITSLSSFASKAYTTAYGGAAADVPSEILKEAKTHTGILTDIRDRLAGKDKGGIGGVGPLLPTPGSESPSISSRITAGAMLGPLNLIPGLNRGVAEGVDTGINWVRKKWDSIFG